MFGDAGDQISDDGRASANLIGQRTYRCVGRRVHTRDVSTTPYSSVPAPVIVEAQGNGFLWLVENEEFL